MLGVNKLAHQDIQIITILVHEVNDMRDPGDLSCPYSVKVGAEYLLA